MKYLLYILFIVTIIPSCKKSQQNEKKLVSAIANGDNLELLKEASNYERWIKVRKYDDLLAIYIPCEGKTMELFKNGNKLEITEPIEDLILPISKEKIIDSNSYRIYTSEINYFSFTIFDKQRKVFQCKYFENGKEVKLYNMLMISKKVSSNFKEKNQPCTDCFSKEECDRFKNISSVKYSKPSTVVGPNNNWFGEYYFEERETGKTILLSKNEMIFEATGMRYHVKYQLSANQVGDTLGLYYHKGLSGDSNNLEVYLPLIKLYKKGDKYYIKSILTDDNWEETEVEKF